jgi:hypothetical protein
MHFKKYFLRFIIVDININISRHILIVDTSLLVEVIWIKGVGKKTFLSSHKNQDQ